MNPEFLRRQAMTALRLAEQCTDSKVAARLKVVAEEMLKEAQRFPQRPPSPRTSGSLGGDASPA